MITIGLAIGERNGGVAFATTHWSVVATAQGESPAAEQALEKLCRTYWRPLYGFVRRQGFGPENAQDMVQEFFATLSDGEISGQPARRKDVYVLICLYRLNDFWRANGTAQTASSDTRRALRFLWMNYSRQSASTRSGAGRDS